MAESVTISRKEPALKSMNYAFLREQGIQHIQRLAGKLWTNFNNSDPGVTILEVLSYAITDLGYRSSYEMKDLIAADPSDPAAANIRNFFTALQILPNAPVTINDYRKLLMDVDVHDPLSPGSEFVGVKNAWIECSEEAEKKLYVWRKKSRLDYTPDPVNTEQIKLEVLYNVLLELEECEEFGDMNENTLEGIATLYAPAGCSTFDTNLTGIKVMVEVEFPRWDDPVNWDDPDDIRKNTKSVFLSFLDLPGNYHVEDYWLEKVTNYVKVAMTDNPNSVDTTCVESVLNTFVYDATTGLLEKYQRKVKKIMQIIDKVKATLMANRNLCEDFFRIQALKVEEIAVCADVELSNEANVEQTLAAIYYEIDRFLSPTVYFYDLEEMYEKGKTSEEIFEGPKLAHGFIDDAELKKADRRKSLHVSDLISIIMDIPGVQAVKSIQIANIPLDNDDKIPQKSVKWCLELAVNHGYVPRLTTEHSSITFYKNQLPYKADEVEVESLFTDLKSKERKQKLHSVNLQLDIPVPEGEFKALGEYTSIQEEFPLTYGIGQAGLPSTATELRKAQAKQLKGFLMFFDQVLADYLSQLANVRELFAMNAETDAAGEYIINKSYFAQNLVNIVPDAAALYVNQTGHSDRLEVMNEDLALFESRRNKFLDHLMARFSEQFTDYALLSYKLTGAKTPQELIEDKLAFLNSYPEISSGRDKGFNYEDPCMLWHVDNVSGLEKRASMLAGIDARTADDLVFTSSVQVYQSTSGYVFDIIDTSSTAQEVLLTSAKSYATLDEAKLAAEDTLGNAVVNERYKLVDSNGKVVDDYNLSPALPYEVAVICDGEAIAKAPGLHYTEPDAEDALVYTIQNALPVAEEEFYNNPQSNRNNKACILENYFTVSTVTTDIVADPPTYSFSYTLYDLPFDFSTGNPELFSGTYTGLGETGDTAAMLEEKGEAIKHQVLFDVLRAAIDIDNYSYRTISLNTQVFDIGDRCGNIMATSGETDFNETIRQTIPGSITVEGSTGNDNTTSLPSYTVLNTYRDDRALYIEVAESIASLVPDGYVVYDESFSITAVSQLKKTFSIASDVSRRLFPGEKITITGGSNDGTYTVERVTWDGTSSAIKVTERIRYAAYAGTLAYTKRFTITGVENDTNGNFFTIKPGTEIVAAKEMVTRIRERFFSNEGFHVIEHILLRPKTNEDIYLRINASNGLALPTTGSSLGTMEYTKEVVIGSVTTNQVIIPGNLASEFTTNQVVYINGSYLELNDTKYKVASASYVVPNTVILLQSQIVDQTAPYGVLRYRTTTPVADITDNDTLQVSIPASSIYATDAIIITGATDSENNGQFLIDNIDTNSDITISHRLTKVQDALLPINMNADCEDCRITDPYSFIASIVLPYWQGRFINMDFRRFFERTLLMEAPAHIALNICWVSCEHMEEFEEKYKRWIVENSKRTKDKVALSKALGDLIDILIRLRSVYPPGTLHDCDTDPQLKNSIILNNTSLGNCNF